MKRGDLVYLRSSSPEQSFGLGSINSVFLAEEGCKPDQPVPVERVDAEGKPIQVRLPSGYLLTITQRDIDKIL